VSDKASPHSQGHDNSEINPPSPFAGLTIGRMVHFVLNINLHSPAIVTNVIDKEAGIVSLRVITNDTDNPRWIRECNYSDHHEEYTWHWIERED